MMRESVSSARKCRSQREDKMTATRAQKDGGCQSAALRDCHHKQASPCHTAARREDGVCKSGCRGARPRFGRTETPGRRTTPMQRHRVLPRSPPIPRGSRPKMKKQVLAGLQAVARTSTAGSQASTNCIVAKAPKQPDQLLPACPAELCWPNCRKPNIGGAFFQSFLKWQCHLSS